MGESDGFREGWFFADSDAYKWLDAASRIYGNSPDPKLKTRMDELIRLLTKIELTGQATTLVAVLFLGGVQLISLGILGEYLGRVYDEVRGRPIYLVDEVRGFGTAMAERTASRPGRRPVNCW